MKLLIVQLPPLSCYFIPLCSRSMTYGNDFRHLVSNEVCPPSLHLGDHNLIALSTPSFRLVSGLPLFLLPVDVQFNIF
jgi:hypothetical protein